MPCSGRCRDPWPSRRPRHMHQRKYPPARRNRKQRRHGNEPQRQCIGSHRRSLRVPPSPCSRRQQQEDDEARMEQENPHHRGHARPAKRFRIFQYLRHRACPLPGHGKDIPAGHWFHDACRLRTLLLLQWPARRHEARDVEAESVSMCAWRGGWRDRGQQPPSAAPGSSHARHVASLYRRHSLTALSVPAADAATRRYYRRREVAWQWRFRINCRQRA